LSTDLISISGGLQEKTQVKKW